MNTTHALPPLTLSSRDLARLEQLLDSPALRRLPAAQALAEEIGRATVLPPEQMPDNVVTMNSTATCVDEVTGEQHRVTIVYPRDADLACGRVSVLAPVGSALIGLAVGQSIQWPAPGGPLKLRLASIQYQPEAAGDINR